MNRLLCTIATLLIIPIAAVSLFGQENAPPAAPAMEEMMKLWEQVSTPGAEHARLNDFAGSWTTTSTMFMDPEHPMVTSGTAEVKWILGGRFLYQEFTGEMLGKPLNGIGFTGYDIYNKKYVGVWVDNSSTAMFTMEGAFDQSGRVLTTYGKTDEWMTGERDKNVKYVLRMETKDRMVFEIYDLSIADDAKMVEVVYKRK